MSQQSSDPGETDALSGLDSFHHLKRHGLHQRQLSSSRRHQRCRPTLGCLMITVAFTLLGTAALSASIFTDYWERIDYNVSSIDAIAQRSNGTHRLTWLFNKTVARIVLNPLASSSTAGSKLSGRTPSSSNSYLLPKRNASNATTTTTTTPIRLNDGLSLDRPFGAPNYVQFASIDRQQEISKQRWSGFSHPEDGAFNKSRILSRRNRRHATSNGTHRRKKRAGSTRRRPDSLFYLIPLHGGIWHLCVDLQNDQLRMLQEMGLDRDACTEYLATSGALAASGVENDAFRVTSNYLNHHVQSKMHNLSISCAMVCVILLASAALLGTFGIMKRQISAVLITGVMYILAALFAVFSLVIMHCKRNSRRETGFVDDPLVNPVEYNEARIFSNSWSMLLGWAGSAVIFVASIFWLFLAKVMRYNQLTFFF
ncbi:uncharacterized protein LOC124343263 [Daphnia pulicaria]|uniref:uncharacterized protein LOC124343263 n=1 Tax=Daphnia pulicaria TaxID=35523 RepID=UPI001EECDF93|nr:uncharacterized protein LOC124343263 [Daphnia pulicaria]